MTKITSKRLKCDRCPFFGPKVGTRGPVDSPFMIVGESPGRTELIEGLPFVGPSWEVLKHALERSQLPWVEPYITNAMHCWPGNKKSEEKMRLATACCQSPLIDEINAYPRKLLLTLGTPALQSVTNNFGLKITKERGKYIRKELSPSIVSVEHALATIHPAFILRGGGNARQFRGDIYYGLQLLNGGDVKRYPVVDFTVCNSELDLYRCLVEFEKTVRNAPNQELDAAADIETGSDPSDPMGSGGFSHIDDAILSIGVAHDPKHVWIIPEELITHPYTRRLFQIKGILWVYHNGKFDVKFMRSFGIEEAYVDEDTMLQSYTLDERTGGGKIHGLEIVAHDWLASPDWKGMLDKYVKKGQSYRVIPPTVLFQYQAYDVSNSLRLKRIMQPYILEDKNNTKLYYRTLIPASEFLSWVEDRGLCVDFQRVRENERRLNRLATTYADEIFSYALKFQRDEINSQGKKVQRYTDKLCNSPIQLVKLLFDDLELPTKIRSTSDDVLEKIPAHPCVKALRNYRKVFKQLSTYVRPLYHGTDSDGKVHASFKLHVTSTGRLASGNPINLQNIPRDAAIRGQFVPAPNHIFIEPDLNQAELRSLAVASGDPLLIKIYTDPTAEGVHDTMRLRMYGDPKSWSTLQFERFIDRWFLHHVEPERRMKAVIDEQKMKAKNVNFGIIYGITKYGLAEQLECSFEEAQRYLDIWADTFKVAWACILDCMEAPARGQNLVTAFGNKKRHHVVTPENFHMLQKEAANFPHQATASHIMLHGAMEVSPRYKQDYDAHIVNMNHDGMLIECPLNYASITAICEDVVKVLERVPPKWGITRIPFVAEVKLGMRWGRDYMTDYKKWKAAQPNWTTNDGRGNLWVPNDISLHPTKETTLTSPHQINSQPLLLRCS